MSSSYALCGSIAIHTFILLGQPFYSEAPPLHSMVCIGPACTHSLIIRLYELIMSERFFREIAVCSVFVDALVHVLRSRRCTVLPFSMGTCLLIPTHTWLYRGVSLVWAEGERSCIRCTVPTGAEKKRTTGTGGAVPTSFSSMTANTLYTGS